MEKIPGGSAKIWRERIEAQGLSGKTAAQFCKEKGWSAWAFYGWKKKLKRFEKSSSGFIVVPQNTGGSQNTGERSRENLRIDLPGGVRIEWGGGLESEVVRRFLADLCGMREVHRARA